MNGKLRVVLVGLLVPVVAAGLLLSWPGTETSSPKSPNAPAPPVPSPPIPAEPALPESTPPEPTLPEPASEAGISNVNLQLVSHRRARHVSRRRPTVVRKVIRTQATRAGGNGGRRVVRRQVVRRVVAPRPVVRRVVAPRPVVRRVVAPRPALIRRPACQGRATASQLRVTSTAYALRGTMANGERVHEGAVAMNCIPFGTRYRVLDGPRAGALLTVKDRIGHGSDFDIWMPTRSVALTYGRQLITVHRVP